MRTAGAIRLGVLGLGLLGIAPLSGCGSERDGAQVTRSEADQATWAAEAEAERAELEASKTRKKAR